ncbi:hypothetical protein O181_004865 [Austropuccinia psidii MF-1]|uniref:Uncharacterized protein n=1 Tax=Austropuccinia psidii MF-1 TaxID=1389203 RepID=A0A9Q3BHV8_9BASI|nr:hypothetical protein [Austropuccinia psidii MF-1]
MRICRATSPNGHILLPRPYINKAASSSDIRNYRKMPKSIYFEGYSKFVLPRGPAGVPEALCLAPAKYAHCTSCTSK